jgi:hypothetical protein
MPKLRLIRVHHLDRSSDLLEETDTLSEHPVMPGFSILAKDLLPPLDGHRAS